MNSLGPTVQVFIDGLSERDYARWQDGTLRRRAGIGYGPCEALISCTGKRTQFFVGHSRCCIGCYIELTA